MSENTVQQRMHAQWLMKFVADAIWARLRSLVHGDLSSRSSQSHGVRKGVDVLSPMLDRTVRASGMIEGNASVSLVIEALFDDLARTLRTGIRKSSG